jgi:hypothetical protein
MWPIENHARRQIPLGVWDDPVRRPDFGSPAWLDLNHDPACAEVSALG